MKRACFSLFLSCLLGLLFSLTCNATCNCTVGNGSSFIGNELIADSCPPEGADDNTEYHYVNYGVQCSGGRVTLYAPWGDTNHSPAFVTNYYANQGLRVLRNPAGTHIIALAKYFKGKINGISTSSLSPGIYTFESLNDYCFIVSGLIDSDNDGWPICFDCNDNDYNYTSECPLLVVEEKNLGYQPCKYHAYAGNPVNIATGNKYQKETDIAPGPTPMALEFTRHYNSRSTVDRSIGYGWSYTYDRYLTFSDGKILSHREDGRVIFFSSSTLEAESGAREKLVHNEDGTYTLKTINRVDELYDSGGTLLSLTDLNGNTVSLAYQEGHLAIVTDPFGRTLTFSYNPSGRIESITDPAGKIIQFAYDSNDNLTLVTYQDGSTREYVYDDPNDVHNLTGIVDENGNRYATFAYDDSDRAILSTHAGDSKRIDIAYGEGGDRYKTTVTDGRGNTTTYTFQVIKDIAVTTSVKGPGCSSCGKSDVTYVYDQDTLDILSKTDGEGNTTRYEDFDQWGNAGTVVEASGTPIERTITKTFDSNLNKLLSITLPSTTPGEQKTTTYTYDSHGNLLSRTETGFSSGVSTSKTTGYSYNSKGQVTEIDGPRTDVTDTVTFSYDSMGNLASVTRPLIGTTTYEEYDAFGRVGKITDPNGLVTTYSYDDRGRITKINRSGHEIDLEYNPNGTLKKITMPEGETLNYSYDDAQRLIQVTDSFGNRIAYTLDPEGGKEKEEIFDSNGTLVKTLSRLFDEYNRIRSLIQPYGTTSYEYNKNGKLTKETDPSGNIKSYSYDALKRLAQLTDPSPDGSSPNPKTGYEYDTQDNLVKVTDANGNEITYKYDDFGNLLKKTSPDTGITVYTYDSSGNLISKTDANGNTITYTYDALNRLTHVHFPDPAEDISYSYDGGTNGKGRLTGIVDPSGTYSFSYDLYGNLAKEEKIVNGISYVLEYSYNKSGAITDMVYPDGLQVHYDLDQMGRVTAVSVLRNWDSTVIASQVGYLPFGPMKGLSFGNGIELVKSFDQAYRITSIKAGSVEDLNYTYDSRANITGITDNLDSSLDQTFSYDNLNRLIHAEGVYGTIDYSYDAVGNRLNKTLNSTTDTYSYFTGTNKLSEVTGSNSLTFSYDQNGNTISMGTRTFTYNQNNRLIKASENGSVLGEYTYNAFGQRIIKETNGKRTIYHYDQLGNIISEETIGSETVRDYIYIGHSRVAMVVSERYLADLDKDNDVDGNDLATLASDFNQGDCSTACPCPGDINGDGVVDSDDLSILASELGRTDCPHDEYYYFHNDHLGTPQRITDQSGTIVWSANYRPFGQVDIMTNTITNPFRFPGQYLDPETGLHYNYFRYYDPVIGRYLRVDPVIDIILISSRKILDMRRISFISVPLATTLSQQSSYCFVLNNPLSTIDPKGLEVFILGRTPYFYRIPVLRRLVRIAPESIPKETPINPKYVPRPVPIGRQLGLPREDLWWQQDPFPAEPKPYNPNNPELFFPLKKEDTLAQKCNKKPYRDLYLHGNRMLPFDRLFNPIGCL